MGRAKDCNEPQHVSQPTAAKKAYTKPTLRRLGTVAELTQTTNPYSK
jgi:hypothetical protein